MKRALLTTSTLAALLLATSLPSGAAPTLIGDTISILRSYPTTTTQYGNAIPDTTVAAGNADVVSWSYTNSWPTISFDPEANSLWINFLTNTAMISTATEFDGFVISGIDAEIASLSILSNTTTYAVAALTNDGHGFTIGLNGVSLAGSVQIGLQLRDPGPAALPEPGTTGLAFAALGLLGVQSRRRRARG